MTRRGRVRAAEPTAAFSPQRKCKTVWSWSHLRNQKKNSIRMDAVLFCLRSPNAGPPPSRRAGRTGSRRTKQTPSLAHSRDPVVTSPTSATKKKNSIRMDAVLFCLRSPNAGPPPSRLAGRTGSRCTKQTLSLTFSRDPVVTSPTSATISRSQKRYHGFEPPKSHDFGGFSRVCSLFRNHEVCGYRVQKKRYDFKKRLPAGC